MRRTCTALLSGWLAFSAGSALLAAPGQGRAGEIEPAKVWIQNRGSGEAVPVAIEAVELGKPLPVQVTTMPPVTIGDLAPLRQARQPWEYLVLSVSAGEDLATMLMNAGRDGWEVTGAQLPSRNGTAIVLKRPR